MFNGGETKTVYGFSQNCYESFGISANFAYDTQHEITLDKIIPDLKKFWDEILRSPNGY
jgi:hypothetical protein